MLMNSNVIRDTHDTRCSVNTPELVRMLIFMDGPQVKQHKKIIRSTNIQTTNVQKTYMRKPNTKAGLSCVLVWTVVSWSSSDRRLCFSGGLNLVHTTHTHT